MSISLSNIGSFNILTEVASKDLWVLFIIHTHEDDSLQPVLALVRHVQVHVDNAGVTTSIHFINTGGWDKSLHFYLKSYFSSFDLHGTLMWDWHKVSKYKVTKYLQSMSI